MVDNGSKRCSDDSEREADCRRPTILIDSESRWNAIDLSELWRFRELIELMAWRDISSRYREMTVGVGWVVIQPVLLMLIFTVFFGKVIKVPSGGVPYPLFSYSANLLWQYFSSILISSSTSVYTNAALLTKIYFPRLVIPVSTTLPPLLDFSIAFVLLIPMMLYFGFAPGLTALSLPLFILIAGASALGAGLWLTALGMRYRDVRQLTPFLLQAWMFCSPVIYPSSMVPRQWKDIYLLNPMVGALDGFRWAMMGVSSPSLPLSIMISIAVSSALILSGAIYFRQVEQSFADNI